MRLLKRGEEIGQAYEQLVDFYKDDQDISIKRLVATGMYLHAKGLFEHNRGYTAIGTIKRLFEYYGNDRNDPEINKILDQTEQLKKQLSSTITW